jgi:sugar phosphate isomerase/epimerase
MNLPLFSVSEFTTWHLSFEEDLALYRQLGLAGIEVCERKLSSDPARAREQLAQLKASGLRVTSVQPRCHALFPDSMSPAPADPRERLALYRQTIDLFAEAFPGENLPLVAIGGHAPGYNFRLARQTARALYPALADYAAERGARIMFEPLNPMFMGTDGFVCSLDGAVELVRAVNRPNFGLLLDTWHVWREPGLTQRVAALGDRIFGVHICDWPAGEPRAQGDRVLPGDGQIDLPAILGAVEAGGYRGAYCLEIFSADDLPGSLWQADPAAVIRRGRAGFAAAWQKGGRR